MRRFSPVPGVRVLVLAVVLAALAGQVAWAHPADMYFQSHTIHLTPRGIRMTWLIYPGPLLAPSVWLEANRDKDKVVSPGEAIAWVEPRLAALSTTLDDTTPLAWRLESVEWPSSFTAMQVGDEKVIAHLTADWPTNLVGNHHLTLHNLLYEKSVSIEWFYLHGDDGVNFHTPEQQNSLLQLDFVIPEAGQPTPEDGLTYWDSGTPSLLLPGIVETTGTTAESEPQDRRPVAILTRLVRTEKLSPGFYLIALAVAGIIGALHALTPGHGKTVVAAYLIGLRGTAWHAITLGSIVTTVHTGSVFALGLLTLAASQYIMPTSVFPVLEIASGLLIVGLGVYLLYQRWRDWHSGNPTADQHLQQHQQQQNLPDLTVVTWRSLLTLGVSGGLVPCPDAIAILLVAVAINRIALGLSLIVSFSAGLAVVLIAIGMAMVHSYRLLNRLGPFNRLLPLMPLVSALVVLGLGLGLTASAANRAGLLTPPETTGFAVQAADDKPQQAEPRPRPFNIDWASILYTAPDEQERRQLLVIPAAGGEPLPLTQEPVGVQDYALAPDGTTIAYTALRENGGSSLWGVNSDGSNRRLLLDCPASACSGPVWSPDGQRLVYEKRDIPPPGSLLALPSLWWLDVSTGQTGPIFQDSQLPGSEPRWSPDGEWLSYISPGSREVEIYNLQDGRRHSIPRQTVEPVIWSPDGDALLMTDVWNRGKQPIPLIHLLRFELESGQVIDLSGEADVEDSQASWSPDGEWIAVVRWEPTSSGASPSLGNQLWLLRPDGSQDRPLTDDPEIIHQSPVWSPDGSYLLFQQYPLKTPQAQLGVWSLNIETGRTQEIVTPGYQPTWLP
jgi:ABC-type nickel/cobalt efflux system permease component RcnA/Tol biopolymer transport system component